MKKILAIITFLLFLLLLWYTKHCYDKCYDDDDTTKDVITDQKPVIKIKKDGPLVYKWRSSQAITNDLWGNKKKNILNGNTDGKVLQISGPYFEDEGAAIGISRAKNAYAKLGSDTTKIKKVEFKSKLIKYYVDAVTKRFGGTDFSWLVRNENIIQIVGKTTIYFPTNSTKKISNSNIVNYLKDVANSLSSNDKKVYLSGHSDNRGSASKNKKLALARANSIKSELVRLGVDSNRISVISYGEEQPIEDNNTKKGQKANRRVELEIK